MDDCRPLCLFKIRHFGVPSGRRRAGSTFQNPRKRWARCDNLTFGSTGRRAEDGQGGGQYAWLPPERRQLCVIKIFTSKSLGLNRLPTILAEPAPVKAFRKGSPKTAIFPGVKRAQTVTWKAAIRSIFSTDSPRRFETRRGTSKSRMAMRRVAFFLRGL